MRTGSAACRVRDNDRCENGEVVKEEGKRNFGEPNLNEVLSKSKWAFNPNRKSWAKTAQSRILRNYIASVCVF